MVAVFTAFAAGRLVALQQMACGGARAPPSEAGRGPAGLADRPGERSGVGDGHQRRVRVEADAEQAVAALRGGLELGDERPVHAALVADAEGLEPVRPALAP